MMRKTLTLLALSQIALAGALYASDGNWFDEPQDSGNILTVKQEAAATIGMSHAYGVPGSDRLCDKAYWPYIPAECLSGETAEVADEVRTISIN